MLLQLTLFFTLFVPKFIWANFHSEVQKLGKLEHTNFNQIQNQFLSSSVKQIPYAHYYWPVAQGQLATRHSVLAFPDLNSTGGNFSRLYTNIQQHFRKNPATGFIPSKIHLLSPSEKYDLLLKDISRDFRSSKKAHLRL